MSQPQREPGAPPPPPPPPPPPARARAQGPDGAEPGAETAREAGLLRPRKLAAQVLGFVIGVGLLAWCIAAALSGGGDSWRRLVHADPLLVVGLAACTIVSLGANGSIFWIVVQPMRHLRLDDLLKLNVVTAILNYAPIRLGFIARVAYHLRVDRMSLLQIGAWLAAITYTLALTLGAVVVATIARPRIDAGWLGLLVLQLALGGLLTWAIMKQPLVVRLGRGMDRMLSRASCLWGAIGMRLVDVAAYVGRMAFAAAVLGLDLPVADVMLLGIAVLLLSLNPLGRTGFREIAVAFVASRMISHDLGAIDLDSQMATLALVESAGEALVAIPAGIAALIWYRRRWIAARSALP